MCHNCKDGACKKMCCTPSMIAKVLILIGGINWGLVGAGMLLGSGSEWNVVHLLLGSVPVVEGIVYLLVGISALVKIFGCRCKKCMSGVCGTCGVPDKCMCGGNCMNGKCDTCGMDCGKKM